MLCTVLIIRWFGSNVYADFLVDSAYLALPCIILEIVPSNYSVFRVQDDPTRIRGLAALAIISAIILACTVHLMSNTFNIFNAYSIWITPYAGLMAIKRYLDIRLQSSGRLREYFVIEFRSALFRIIFMGAFLWQGNLPIKMELSAFTSCFASLGSSFTETQSLKELWSLLKNCFPNTTGTAYFIIQPIDAVWASLTSAVFFTQVIWFVRRPDECKILIAFSERSAWASLFEERRSYVPYYLGIALKRLRDNLVPVLANNFFVSRESLGAFFLVYRGLIFTVGQIRVIEGFLNHRITLSKVDTLSFYHRVLVAIFSQLICISTSLILMVASDVQDFQIHTVVILSFTVWCYVFSILERAKAYSSYDTFSVNLSMLVNCSVITSAVLLLINLGIRTESAFSIILVFTEVMSLTTLYLLKNKK